jgi:hypothetical protein
MPLITVDGNIEAVLPMTPFLTLRTPLKLKLLLSCVITLNTPETAFQSMRLSYVFSSLTQLSGLSPASDIWNVSMPFSPMAYISLCSP